MLESAFRKVDSISVVVRGETGMVGYTCEPWRHNAWTVMGGFRGLGASYMGG